MDGDFQLELLAFDEKIALAELETSKAEERVKELKYSKARYSLEWVSASMKARQQAQQAPQQGK